MRKFLLLLICAYFSANASAKDFIRDYTYHASDNDSKISARSNAIEQIKLILLEEIGVYIQSYVEIDKRSKDDSSSVFLTHEINTTTAGITKTQILSESWNGKEYKLRAKVSIDVEDVIKKINDTIKARENSENVAELNRLLKEKNGKILNLSVALSSKEKELNDLSLQLVGLNSEIERLKIKLQKQLQQEKLIRTKIGKIRNRISNVSASAEKFSPGMTQRDLEKIAGQPASIDAIDNLMFLNYGKYWAYLPSGIFKRLIPVSEYSGPNYGYDRN